MVENVKVVESLGSSDHNSIEFSVKTQVQLKESKNRYLIFVGLTFKLLGVKSQRLNGVKF